MTEADEKEVEEKAEKITDVQTTHSNGKKLTDEYAIKV